MPNSRAGSRLGPERPFPGLRPYGFVDHDYFHGRVDQVYALYRLLDRSRFTAVVGTSGSGKSSLVRAGLLPLLQEETDEARTRRWQWFELRPGNTPFARLAAALLEVEPETRRAPDPEIADIRRNTIEVLLQRSSFGLRDALRELRELDDYSILIVVDQFEEIFRYADLSDGEDADPFVRDSRHARAAAFVQLLLEASRDRARPIHVMLTMRSDYLGDCALFHDLPEAVAASQFLVPSLTRDQREQAIRGPIEQAGATIEPELVQRLLNESGTGNDQLPVLQHALMRTWDEAGRAATDAALASRSASQAASGPRHLTSRHYEAIGTLANALSQHAEEIMSELGGLEQAVEQTFRALAELDRDRRAIRRPRSFDRLLAESGVPEADLRRVLDRFRRDDCSFLAPPHPEPIDGDTIVDIGHEALIRRWDRMGADQAPAGGGKGWLWAEAEDGNVYRGLLALAGGDSADGVATLPLDQVESRWRWWASRPRTEAWAARYGGRLDSVRNLFDNSRRALRKERRRLAKEDADRRRRVRLAFAAAVVCAVLAGAAMVGGIYAVHQKRRADAAAEQALAAAARAEEALIETKAASFWPRLQLWGDPLRPEDVATLWELTQVDGDVRVAFVRQLASDQVLLRRFGFKPQPIARAIGLRWSDEALDIAKQSIAHVASGQFDPATIEPFDLVAYTGALAALAQWLDAATREAATRNIAGAINGLAASEPLSDQQLWALVETVRRFTARLDPAPIEPARSELREIIRSATPSADAGWRGQAISGAIELMAPQLDAAERRQAVRYLVALLGRNTDSWSAKAVPRALSALLPELDPGDRAEVVNALPTAIATTTVAKGDQDNSYLLALMALPEALGSLDDLAGGAAFGQALVARFALPNDLPQRAALARATVPALEPQADRAGALLPTLAAIILVPEATGEDLDPIQRSHLRQANLRAAEKALRQALSASAGADLAERSEAALTLLEILRTDWRAAPPSNSRLNPYRRAAQARLLEMLAPSLPQAAAATAARDLQAILRDSRDYLMREAIARALQALAPQLREADRKASLATAGIALAKTGSPEEATAWARAITALLPDGPAAAAQIVEALKYPTATGAPSDVLLAALASRWPGEPALKGRTLPDQDLLDWLEARLPDGPSLVATPPTPPPQRSEDGAIATRD